MAPHQQRVVDEKVELDKKIEALNLFIDSRDKPGSIFANLPQAERDRLYVQVNVMATYSDILAQRIAAF